MEASAFTQALLKKLAAIPNIHTEIHQISYRGGMYPFIKIVSNDIGPHDNVFLIRAGIHGNEIAGPLSILQYINEILDCIHANHLKVVLYPLGNPSGFERGTRYNIDNDKGAAGNNDFLRYELADGNIVDEIGPSDCFTRWYWSSHPRLGISLPQETKLMHSLLRQDPLDQIVACLDLHQDYITPHAPAAAYQYAYGDLETYLPIVRTIEQMLPLFKNRLINAGYASGIASQSDEQGFIVRHDGTLPDLLWRLGARHAITVETTGITPIDIAMRVNLAWIFGLVEILGEKNC